MLLPQSTTDLNGLARRLAEEADITAAPSVQVHDQTTHPGLEPGLHINEGAEDGSADYLLVVPRHLPQVQAEAIARQVLDLADLPPRHGRLLEVLHHSTVGILGAALGAAFVGPPALVLGALVLVAIAITLRCAVERAGVYTADRHVADLLTRAGLRGQSVVYHALGCEPMESALKRGGGWLLSPTPTIEQRMRTVVR